MITKVQFKEALDILEANELELEAQRAKDEEERIKHTFDNLYKKFEANYRGEDFYLENSLTNHKKEIVEYLSSNKFIFSLDELIKYHSKGAIALPIGFMNTLKKAKVLKDDNTPYQEYIDKEYFRVVEFKYTLADSTKNVLVMTLVSEEGAEFIEKIFKEKGLIW